jgi:excisionase family DNA binding protein
MTAAQARAKGRVQAPGVERQAYSVRELAAALGYSLDTIYRGMHAGEIPYFRLRGEYRVPASWLAGVLAEAEAQVAS